jgi:hypothetical protein
VRRDRIAQCVPRSFVCIAVSILDPHRFSLFSFFCLVCRREPEIRKSHRYRNQKVSGGIYKYDAVINRSYIGLLHFVYRSPVLQNGLILHTVLKFDFFFSFCVSSYRRAGFSMKVSHQRGHVSSPAGTSGLRFNFHRNVNVVAGNVVADSMKADNSLTLLVPADKCTPEQL